MPMISSCKPFRSSSLHLNHTAHRIRYGTPQCARASHHSWNQSCSKQNMYSSGLHEGLRPSFPRPSLPACWSPGDCSTWKYRSDLTWLFDSPSSSPPPQRHGLPCRWWCSWQRETSSSSTIALSSRSLRGISKAMLEETRLSNSCAFFVKEWEAFKVVLTLFCGGVAHTCHDDRVVELKEQLVVEEVDGERQ